MTISSATTPAALKRAREMAPVLAGHAADTGAARRDASRVSGAEDAAIAGLRGTGRPAESGASSSAPVSCSAPPRTFSDPSSGRRSARVMRRNGSSPRRGLTCRRERASCRCARSPLPFFGVPPPGRSSGPARVPRAEQREYERPGDLRPGRRLGHQRTRPSRPPPGNHRAADRAHGMPARFDAGVWHAYSAQLVRAGRRAGCRG